jgi:hypothetical protein
MADPVAEIAELRAVIESARKALDPLLVTAPPGGAWILKRMERALARKGGAK